MVTRRVTAVVLLCTCVGLAGCFLWRVAPTAAVTAERVNADTFRFSALDSNDPDGSIVGISWDFGDGSTGTGATPLHEYSAPGEYVVVVEVRDDDGLVATATIAVVAGRVIHVPEDFPSIQDAIDASSDGDMVELAAGAFAEYVRFAGKEITLRGAGQATTTLRRPPIGSGSNPTSVVTFDANETSSAILESLTIQGDAWSFDHGGAIRIVKASPTIRDCIISSHGASFGGAVYAWESEALFEGNRFLNNLADVDGGAVLAVGTSQFPDFVDNEFVGNLANAGGAICLRAAGGLSIAPDAKVPEIRNNTFEANEAIGIAGARGLVGGAIHVGSGVRVVLNDNLFTENLPTDVFYEDGTP